MIAKLTEWKFRSYWARTGDDETKEAIRFAKVVRLMEEEITLRKNAPKEPIRPRLIEKFGDTRWHKLETIVKALGEGEPYVKDALDKLYRGERRGHQMRKETSRQVDGVSDLRRQTA